MYKVYIGYNDTKEIEHGLSASTIDNPLAKAHGLFLCTGGQNVKVKIFSFMALSKVVQSYRADRYGGRKPEYPD